ncbi:hypothetical protein CSH63_05615 [Micromonospora tulbaghiae]|uniref:Uncharacterized protein n=1 Tax=Micromonospora tulbaghiae TaxID=479978 RepID=A0A386WJR2_9ACTN|nr:hypothetical protein CSH63_05615 [Micromonospora tulbaghiae]
MFMALSQAAGGRSRPGHRGFFILQRDASMLVTGDVGAAMSMMAALSSARQTRCARADPRGWAV